MTLDCSLSLQGDQVQQDLSSPALLDRTPLGLRLAFRNPDLGQDPETSASCFVTADSFRLAYLNLA